MASALRYVRCASLLALLCAPARMGAQGVPPDRIREAEPKFNSSSSGATFVYPTPGQVVHPGEVLHIDLAISPGVTLAKGAVGIISPMGFSNEIGEGPAYYSFTFSVPNGDVPGMGGPLIGPQPLYASGAVTGRNEVLDLADTTIDIEEPDLPVSLYYTGMGFAPGATLNFFFPGSDEHVHIFAEFPDGQNLDVSNSTYLHLSSSNPAILRVADDNWVVSVSPGVAALIATYTLGDQERQLVIPVSVGNERALAIDPPVVDFGDIPVGTTSPTREVTLTNTSSSDVQIHDVRYNGGPQNCTNAALPPRGSCSLTVALHAYARGPIHLTILIDSWSVVLLGNGT